MIYLGEVVVLDWLGIGSEFSISSLNRTMIQKARKECLKKDKISKTRNELRFCFEMKAQQ